MVEAVIRLCLAWNRLESYLLAGRSQLMLGGLLLAQSLLFEADHTAGAAVEQVFETCQILDFCYCWQLY
jgi:hypothetical protein